MEYQENGSLIPGIHQLDFKTFKDEFGFNKHRLAMIAGLEKAIRAFKSCGATFIYIDGSFVTKKEYPNDYDACWDQLTFNWMKLFTEFPVFLGDRVGQKAIYSGEFFSALAIANPPRQAYLDFLQRDRYDNLKGIVKLIF